MNLMSDWMTVCYIIHKFYASCWCRDTAICNQPNFYSCSIIMHWICLERPANIHLSSMKGRSYHGTVFRCRSYLNINGLFWHICTSHIELWYLLSNPYRKLCMQFSGHICKLFQYQSILQLLCASVIY